MGKRTKYKLPNNWRKLVGSPIAYRKPSVNRKRVNTGLPPCPECRKATTAFDGQRNEVSCIVCGLVVE
jgi:hypothetical protein